MQLLTSPEQKCSARHAKDVRHTRRKKQRESGDAKMGSKDARVVEEKGRRKECKKTDEGILVKNTKSHLLGTSQVHFVGCCLCPGCDRGHMEQGSHCLRSQECQPGP